MVFKFVYFVELGIGHQAAKFQCCRSSRSSFTEGLEKHSDDVVMTSFHVVETWGLQSLQFLLKFYQPAKFQISRLSGSNFMEIGLGHQKHHYYVIMTSFNDTGF